jgi:hypothetical protein
MVLSHQPTSSSLHLFHQLSNEMNRVQDMLYHCLENMKKTRYQHLSDRQKIEFFNIYANAPFLSVLLSALDSIENYEKYANLDPKFQQLLFGSHYWKDIVRVKSSCPVEFGKIPVTFSLPKMNMNAPTVECLELLEAMRQVYSRENRLRFWPFVQVEFLIEKKNRKKPALKYVFNGQEMKNAEFQNIERQIKPDSPTFVSSVKRIKRKVKNPFMEQYSTSDGTSNEPIEMESAMLQRNDPTLADTLNNDEEMNLDTNQPEIPLPEYAKVSESEQNSTQIPKYSHILQQKVEHLKNQIKSSSSIDKQSILNEYYQLLNKREQLRRQLLKEKQALYQQSVAMNQKFPIQFEKDVWFENDIFDKEDDEIKGMLRDLHEDYLNEEPSEEDHVERLFKRSVEEPKVI